MFVGDVLLNKRCCFEQLGAGLASKFTLVFLFDVLLNTAGKLTKTESDSISSASNITHSS